MKADRIWFENENARRAKILRLFNAKKARVKSFLAKIFLCFYAALQRSATLIYYLNLRGFCPLFIFKLKAGRGYSAVWSA